MRDDGTIVEVELACLPMKGQRSIGRGVMAIKRERSTLTVLLPAGGRSMNRRECHSWDMMP